VLEGGGGGGCFLFAGGLVWVSVGGFLGGWGVGLLCGGGLLLVVFLWLGGGGFCGWLVCVFGGLGVFGGVGYTFALPVSHGCP